MRGSQTFAKRPLPLGAPHDSVNVIGTGVVLNETGQKIPEVRIVDAQRLSIPPVQIAFLQFLNIRQVGAKHVLQPAEHLHATLFGDWNHFDEDIQVAMVRRTRILENRIFVVLRMARPMVDQVCSCDAASMIHRD